MCLQYYQLELLELACRSPAVVCCRCSPTQKAQVVRLIQQHTEKRVAAIGDGGNDVSMIQAADTGTPLSYTFVFYNTIYQDYNNRRIRLYSQGEILEKHICREKVMKRICLKYLLYPVIGYDICI